MKLLEEEIAFISRIKHLLQTGAADRADRLAKSFLEGARNTAAVKRRAHLLLRLAGQLSRAAGLMLGLTFLACPAAHASQEQGATHFCGSGGPSECTITWEAPSNLPGAREALLAVDVCLDAWGDAQYRGVSGEVRPVPPGFMALFCLERVAAGMSARRMEPIKVESFLVFAPGALFWLFPSFNLAFDPNFAGGLWVAIDVVPGWQTWKRGEALTALMAHGITHPTIT